MTKLTCDLKQVFNDLDVGLFGGVLGGNVVLRWCFRLDPFYPDTLDAWGWTQRDTGNVPADGHSEPRVMISLNATYLLLDRKASVHDTVRVLVHEMIVS